VTIVKEKKKNRRLGKAAKEEKKNQIKDL